MRGVKKESQAIGAFLEWLSSTGVQLMRYHEHTIACLDEEDRLDVEREDTDLSSYRDRDFICRSSTDDPMPEHRGIEQLLADHFEIDLKVVEEERRALLDWQRKLNG